ncbi:MAG: hypothetical protein V8S27_00530 [Lachnospiraceae bacterium]
MVTAGIAGIFDGNLLAVLVGWKSRTNAGVIAMALACLIKVFFMDGSVNQVIEASAVENRLLSDCDCAVF